MSPKTYAYMAAVSLDLDKLQAFLRRAPATAKQIAKHLECSIPTAYARVRLLTATGVNVHDAPFPTQRPGPMPRCYTIRD